MYRSLATGAIGVGVGSLEEGLEMAARHGFELKKVVEMPSNNHSLVFRKR